MSDSFRIALDATYSVGNELSGIGVYSREMIQGLACARRDWEFVWCYRPHRFLRSLLRPLPRNCRRRVLWENRSGSSADLFHGLNQRLSAVKHRRSVATFHDLFVLTAEYSTEEFRRRFTEQARSTARRADLIIAVSQFTARQVRDLLGVEETRIRVVPHGVRCPREPRQGQREQMVLHVGAIQRRKNVVRLVRAFETVLPGWKLVLAGAAGYGADEVLETIRRSPRRADIRVRGYVSGRELANLYRRAGIFAFPSLDEGFGIPVLEAMAWGVPVITSNRSALPEVSGDAAVLIDPLREREIAEALESVARDDNLADQLRRRGFQRAAQFTWEGAVRRTLEIYRELLG